MKKKKYIYVQNVNLTNTGRVYFCRSLKKDLCSRWFIRFPTLSPSIQLSIRHRPPAFRLVEGLQLTLRLAVDWGAGVHVEWVVRFSFSISICRATRFSLSSSSSPRNSAISFLEINTHIYTLISTCILMQRKIQTHVLTMCSGDLKSQYKCV